MNNRHHFAPGVIEHEERQRSALGTWLKRTAFALIAVSVIYTLAFTAGYYWG